MSADKYQGNELKYIEKVLNSEKWSSTEGSWTNTLEKQFAATFGARYGVAMNSGTAVLHAALVACGIRPGDEVITPGLTVFMDTSAIFHCGAIPIYADIEYNTFNIDPRSVRERITPNTRAIIGVSLYGLQCNVEELSKIANEFDLYFILDNAQHMGNHCGHITTYSFENSKHISCGEGGIAITDDENLAVRMRKLSNHGFRNSTAEEGRTKLNLDEFQDPYYKRHSVVGWNYRLSEFSSAIALAQLEKVKDIIMNRVMAGSAYRELLSGHGFISQADSIGHSYWTFATKYYGDWKRFRSQYIKNGGDGFYGAWSVPYLEPAVANRTFARLNPSIYDYIRYNAGLCPVAEKTQPMIMQFKTNYRDELSLTKQIEALEKTLKER